MPQGGSTSEGGSAPGGTAGEGGSSGGLGGSPSGGAGASGGVAGDGTTGGVGGTATGGTGGGEPVELKMPIERNGKYVLEFGDTLFEVDPAVGARVTTFAYKGTNILTGAAADQTGQGNWGSTFWPSPQTAESWGGMDWPPIPEVDSEPYTASLDGTTIVMTSRVSERGKMSVTKRFTAVLDQQAVDLTFILKNENTESKQWAPWQISRVPLSGLVFFPSSATSLAPPNNPLDATKIMRMGEVSWYKNQPSDFGKYNADGTEGWIGYVSGNLLFVKAFPDVPTAQLAPGEGDTEIYAGMGYVELEPQGPYQTVAAGSSLTWTVRWYLRQLPDAGMATVGNTELVDLVRDTIGRSSASAD